MRTGSFESVGTVTKEVEVNLYFNYLTRLRVSISICFQIFYFVQPLKPRPLPQYFISRLQMDGVHWADEAADTDGTEQKQCGQRQISCQHRLFAKHTPHRRREG